MCVCVRFIFQFLIFSCSTISRSDPWESTNFTTTTNRPEKGHFLDPPKTPLFPGPILASASCQLTHMVHQKIIMMNMWWGACDFTNMFVIMVLVRTSKKSFLGPFLGVFGGSKKGRKMAVFEVFPKIMIAPIWTDFWPKTGFWLLTSTHSLEV